MQAFSEELNKLLAQQFSPLFPDDPLSFSAAASADHCSAAAADHCSAAVAVKPPEDEPALSTQVPLLAAAEVNASDPAAIMHSFLHQQQFRSSVYSEFEKGFQTFVDKKDHQAFKKFAKLASLVTVAFQSVSMNVRLLESLLQSSVASASAAASVAEPASQVSNPASAASPASIDDDIGEPVARSAISAADVTRWAEALRKIQVASCSKPPNSPRMLSAKSWI